MAKAKTTEKASLPLKERAVQAALSLAVKQGWAATSLQDIARACKCSLADLHDIFEDRNDILAAYGRQIDHKVMERISIDPTSPERDRLFDVMMERFDALNDDRDAVISILESFRTDPKQAVITLPHLGRSMIWMLEAAGIEANGPKGAMTALGLTGVYLYTLRAWKEDISSDMGKTMAALDKALGQAESAVQFLGRFI